MDSKPAHSGMPLPARASILLQTVCILYNYNIEYVTSHTPFLIGYW